MYAGVDFEYKVYGCPNNHPLAICLPQDIYKFVSFSELSLSFPNGRNDWADFNNMDFYKISGRLNAAIKDRDRLKKLMKCRICDEKTDYVEHMKKHLKDTQHLQSLEEFKLTLKVKKD